MDDLIEELDLDGTYFLQRKNLNTIPTIFIHGVGLDNTMLSLKYSFPHRAYG